jgi:phosphoribosylcarboxyaminoimidazole (NCAIR) mutase
VSILAHENKTLAKKLEVFREKQAKKVIDMNLSEKP